MGHNITTTTPDYYRCGIRLENETGTVNIDVKTFSGTPVVFAVDDNAAVPGSSDDVVIVGTSGTVHTVTLDGTRTCGADANRNTSIGADGEVSVGVMLCYNGKLKWDTSASATLTIKGSLTMMNGSSLEIGTVATPYPAAYVATLKFDTSTRTYYIAGSSGGGARDMVMVGNPCGVGDGTFYTTVASGTGIAADPVILDDAVDWDVGDKLAFAPGSDSSTNYTETEYKFVITKNSSTSYVLSDTSGGAKASATATGFREPSARGLFTQWPRSVIS